MAIFFNMLSDQRINGFQSRLKIQVLFSFLDFEKIKFAGALQKRLLPDDFLDKPFDTVALSGQRNDFFGNRYPKGGNRRLGLLFGFIRYLERKPAGHNAPGLRR